MDGDPAAGLHVLGHGLAQGQDAVGRRVAVVAVAQGLDRGLDDVGRGREVGLADAEIDDAAAALGQRGGPGQDLEGALRSQTIKRCCKLHPAAPLSCGAAG